MSSDIYSNTNLLRTQVINLKGPPNYLWKYLGLVKMKLFMKILRAYTRGCLEAYLEGYLRTYIKPTYRAGTIVSN
jgi:hypothetical protein